jgi:YesN/AraC family two-component response regulator
MTKQIKILYVEDEISIQKFVKILFKKNNINDVIYASNGQEALELYKNNDFELVITDVMMPVMNGFELIKEIREINSKQIFIMISGLDNKEDLIKTIKLKVNHFIEKPINQKEFKEVLQNTVN